jgi:hypothetical protein
VELIVVSPFAREEFDDATLSVRRSWPGRIRLVPATVATAASVATRVESAAPADDPVIAAIALAGLRGVTASIRLVRGRATANDSAWVRAGDRVLVHWPATEADAAWPRRARVDTVGAATSGSTLVARLPRVWSLATAGGRPIARWIDGELAAVERTLGDGCTRDVAVLLDPASDLALRPAFRSFLDGLLEPCGGARSFVPLPRDLLDSLRGSGPLVPSSLLRDRHDTTSPWTAWLLGAGALLLIIELGVRRQRTVDA